MKLVRKKIQIFWLMSLFWCTIYCEGHKPPNGNCPLGSFPCNSTDLCIPQKQWCDEVVHCVDGSDEAACVDALQDELINQKYKKRPGASNDELPQYCYFNTNKNSNLTKSEEKCQCLQKHIVCRHLNLNHAPNIAEMFDLHDQQVDLLDLGGNVFIHVNRQTFSSIEEIYIKNLVLQHCKIEEITEHSFVDVLNNGVAELHLDGNRLTFLHDKIFNVKNNNLRYLSIGHNSITSIDPNTFQSLTQLIELYLNNNQLKSLNPNWFTTLYNLTILNLQGNLLTKIEMLSWLPKSSLKLNPNDILSDDFINVENVENTSKVFNSNENYNYNEDGIVINGKNYEDLQNEGLKDFSPQGLSKLEWLSLANNKIMFIQDETFFSAPMSQSLIHLDFSENQLSTISNKTFKGLTSLFVLKLNQNNLQRMHHNAFSWMLNLTSLDLQNNENLVVSEKLFRPLTQLQHLYFDSFEMCAYAPLVKVCEPKGDGISSKEHLLDSIILRTSVWIMALIGFIGNLAVILGRQFVTRHSNVVDSLHIKNLAISDILMSLYLFAIGVVDEYYRGEYLKHEVSWRHSNWCTLSGFLNTLSCESSVLILSLVTWDRYVSVTRPFPRNQLSFKFAALRLVTLWAIAALIAVIPILNTTHGYFGFEFYNSNGVCLPLYLHNPYGKGWQYSIAMFVFINFSALVFICYAYLRMIKAIRVSTVACRSTQQTQDRDRVAQHLGIIVFTDCMCWVPVIVIKMATLAGLEFNQTYRNFVYASLAIYVMPINSALNPILYTFATPLFKKQMRKMAALCCSKQKRPEQSRQSGYDSALSFSMGMFGSSNKRKFTYRSTQTSHTGSNKNSWRKQPQAV